MGRRDAAMITWIILRAAGVGAYLLLFGSVAWGLIGTTVLFGKRIPKATSVLIHRFLSTVALALLAVHIGGLLLDRFMPFRPLDALVPLQAHFKPIAVGFGVLAMYAFLVVLVSSWGRKRIGPAWWRRLHFLTLPAFGLAMLHGIFSGTDTVRVWMWWMYVATALVVIFLLAVRGLTADLRPERTVRPARSEADQSSPPERPAASLVSRSTPEPPGSVPA
jgi:sulfoxide reductase heme-binding subunit YedZ